MLTPDLVEEDLGSKFWVMHLEKNSHCGKLYKEATSHMHIIYAYQKSPQLMGQTKSEATKGPPLNKPPWIPGAWTLS